MTAFEKAPDSREQRPDIVEMQPRRRFVEQEQRRALAVAAVSSALAGKKTGQFQSLRFAAAQGRHGLAQPDIAETHRLKRFQGTHHVRVIGEEIARFGYRHLEHVGDRVRAVQLDLQGLGSEPGPVAVSTTQVHVAQELHFHVLEPAARAGGTPAVTRVETERAGRVPALAGKRFFTEDLADRRQRAHVTRGIGPGRLPDRRLVHQHHVPHLFMTAYLPVTAGHVDRLVFQFPQRAVTDVLHQRGFARPADARDANESIKGDANVDPFQVVRRRAANLQPPGIRVHLANARHTLFHLLSAREIVGRQRFPAPQESGQRTAEDNFPASFPGTGPHIDHAVRRADQVGIVLDHEQRVARVAQLLQHADQSPDIPRV